MHEALLVCVKTSFHPVQTALGAIGATYSPGAGPLNGSVAYKGISIPLDSTAAQLWATEMASLYQTAADAAQEHTRRYKNWTHAVLSHICRVYLHQAFDPALSFCMQSHQIGFAWHAKHCMRGSCTRHVVAFNS